MRLRTLLAALSCLFVFFVLPAAAQMRIDAVEVRGNRRVESDTILMQTALKPGSELDPSALDRAIKEVFKTGFFDQVGAGLEQRDGRTILVISVAEKPSVRKVLLQGNKEVSDDTLKEKLSIDARRFLDRRKIAAGVKQALEYYQGQGLYDTKLQYEVIPVDDNQVDLKFTVEEGKTKLVREVLFEGNKNAESSELSDVTKTARYRWWSSWLTGSGVVKKDQLENDVKEIRQFYLRRGFVDVSVSQPEVEATPEGLRVRFRVSEGDQFSFGRISASGALLNNDQVKTLEGTSSKPGEVFDVDLLRKDTFAITDKFTDIGYAFANVDPETQIDRAAKTVDINYRVDKGRLIRIDQINITGNKKTQDHVVRRSLEINERELFSSSKIKRSQELLQRLGYFDEVTITPDPSERQDEVDLNIALKEGTTGSFSAGAGVSSGEGFIFSSRIAENNLFGSGNSVSLNVNSGTRDENYVLSFDNPRVNDSYWSLGTDLMSVDREFDDFDRKQTGGAITAGYPLWFLGPEAKDDYRFSLKYELAEINIDNVDADAPSLVIDQAGESVSSSITPQLVRNTIDNPLDPQSGSRQIASVELAGLGGDQEFWLGQLSNTWYHPLWQSTVGPFVFSQRTRLGYGDTYNDEQFPLFRRFFPGGINSVRGYRARTMGPKDEKGDTYGGSKQLIANFDLIYPIFNSIGLNGVFFYDIGNAFDDDESLDVGGLRQAVGWGIRWRSPIAPIRIEFGYPLDKEDGEKGGMVTNFSFGSPL